MSKYFKYFIAVFIYAGLSCNSPTEPVIINTQTIDTTQLDSLDFQQISYDTVLIKNNNTTNLDPEYLRGIYVGSYNNGMFIAQDTVQPVFDGYTLNINYRMSFPDTQLVAKIGVKFVLDDGNEHMVNRTINLYQYPYPSTKILLRWDEFILRSFYYPDIQDFVYLPPKIYYHPTGVQVICWELIQNILLLIIGIHNYIDMFLAKIPLIRNMILV